MEYREQFGLRIPAGRPSVKSRGLVTQPEPAIKL
jgi:hypothetical protein